MAKFRISHKTLAEFPAEVSAEIKRIGDQYHINSFSYETKPEGYRVYAGEGDRIVMIRGSQRRCAEMVSEASLGAAGVCHDIGAEIAPTAGTFILNVHYYTRYFLSVINITQKALS